MADASIKFVVPGHVIGTTRGGPGRSATSALPGGLRQGTIKHSVRVAVTRDGATETLTAEPDRDIVVLEIQNGPALVLHPEHAAKLMGAQRPADAERGSERAAPRADGAIEIPSRLLWPGVDAPGGAATRGRAGDVLLSAVHVVRDFFVGKVADIAASKLIERFDGQVAEGVYELQKESLPPLRDHGQRIKTIKAAPKDKSSLVLIHGTFSTTSGTFGKLWERHPELVTALFKHFADRVYALDHATLGRGPIANALTLAQALPDKAHVRLVSHSRGGLVAEVLARACADSKSDLSSFAGASYASQRADLTELVSIAAKKQIVVEKLVRVACPARGTLLASNRLDAYLSVFQWSLELAGIPVAPELVDLLASIAQHRKDPEEFPGLAAQIPDSPLVQWLHTIDEPIAGELRVVAGDLEGDSVASWLKTLMSDAFYWTDNDLVVQTRSMFGGSPRAASASFVLDRGGKVSHFNYFSNDRTAEAIVRALTDREANEFRAIGPMSAAGESSTGFRAAPMRRTAREASALPAVFVLPGIVGSNLKVGDDRVWLSWRLVNGLKRIAYAPGGADGVVPDGPVEKVYDGLVDYLSETHEVVEFGFDWRRPIEEVAHLLADEVDRKLDARRESKQPVRMVAHSMGGVLARVMLLERPDTWKRMLADDGARVLMLGTPNAGSWAPMQVLSGDDTFGNIIVAAGLPFHDRKARDLMGAFPGFLQLQAGLLSPELGLSSADTWRKLAQDDLRIAKERLGWHDVPLQVEAVAWGLPSQAVLEQAVSLRKRLDSQLGSSWLETADKVKLVVGHAKFTPSGFQWNSFGLVYLAAPDGGDGRVTLTSALLPGVATWKLDCGHSKLPSESSAFRGYLELLERGTTERLRPLASTATRGAAAPPDSRELRRPSRTFSGTAIPAGLDGIDDADVVAADRSSTAQIAALRVTVHHGDLAFEPRPLMLGHYRSLKLTGTEWVMDALTGGVMRDALALGIYPDLPGTHRIFMNTRFHPDDPSRIPRPEAVIVVGLGHEGNLRATDIVETVCQGALAWAHHVVESSGDGPPSFELAATLLGSGGLGVSAGESARLIAEGVQQANARLADEERAKLPWPRITGLHLIELYGNRAAEAWRALNMLAESAPARFAVAPAVVENTGGIPRPPEFGYRVVDYDFIRAIGEGDEDRQITYSVDSRRAGIETQARSVQTRLVRDLIAQGSRESLRDPAFGRTLFRLLVPMEIEPFLAGTTSIQLQLNRATAGIPWELLDTPARAGVGDEPWAIRAKVIRKLESERPSWRRPDATLDARALVIGEPQCPADYPPLPAARREAKAVADRLDADPLFRVNGVTRLIRRDAKDPGDDAKSVVTSLIGGGDWRIVHISGHGEAPDGSTKPTGIVLSEGHFLSPFEIAGMPAAPELVFVNCCYSGASDPVRLLAPNDPGARLRLGRAELAAGIAEAFITAGTRCVVAAGWAVEDAAAAAFAETFYDAVLRGDPFIEAVGMARAAARDLGGNTWAAYQCYGDPDWTLHGAGDAQRPTASAMPAIASQAGLKLALDTLAVHGKYRTDDRESQRSELTNLETRFGDTWGGIGQIAEAFADACAEIGEHARAIAWYEKALACEDATASVKACEQLANLRAREAWRKFDAARGGDAGKRLAPAALKHARDEIRAAIELIEKLDSVHPSMERESICGSAYKRLTLIEEAAGDTQREKAALERMLRHYRAAEALGREHGCANVFYPALNRMAAQLVLETREQTKSGFEPATIAKLRAELEALARSTPDFWSVAAQTELTVYEAIAGGELAKRRKAIESGFRDLRARVPAPRLWRSVADNARFILPRYQRRAKSKDETHAVDQLLKLLDGFASTSEDSKP